MASDFKTVKDSPFGEISVRTKFEGNALHIEVINARNLIAMDSNGKNILNNKKQIRNIYFMF